MTSAEKAEDKPSGEKKPDVQAKKLAEMPLYRNDKELIKQAKSLQKLKVFLFQSGLDLSSEDRKALTNLGYLNSLRYHRDAADPTDPDWTNVDNAHSALSAHLAHRDDLKNRFQLRLAPRFLFWASVTFAVVSLIGLPIMLRPLNYSLGNAFNLWTPGEASDIKNEWLLFGWWLWSIGLGGLGAVGSLYVNALAIEIDRTVDISDSGFVRGRLILGCLFGFLIGMITLFSSSDNPLSLTALPLKAGIQNSMLLIAPFVYGFSTQLVIDVFNHFIEVIRGLLGCSKK